MLLLDGGNFFQGHPLGIADSGKFMIEWYNQLQYDAMVPGRYDFILGSKNLFTSKKESQIHHKILRNIYQQY